MGKGIKFGIASVPEQRERSLAIVGGTRKVMRGEPKIWFPSISAAMRVVSDENLALLRAIREQHPDSVDALARAVGKPTADVAQSIQTMANFRLVKLKKIGDTIVPVAAIERVTLELA